MNEEPRRVASRSGGGGAFAALREEWRTKALATAAIASYWLLGYFVLNRVEVAERWTIPRTVLDDAPLLPWTVVVYHSVFVLSGLGIWLWSDRPSTFFHLRVVIIAYTINFVFFAALPTRIERPELVESESMWLWAVRLTWAIDAPHTCFPSLHITNCVTAICTHWRTRRGVVFLAWTLPIAASTLTTKQHVFWDVPAGALVGIAGFWLASRLAPRS